MALPLLLGVEDDLEQLRLTRQELTRRYGKDYQVVCCPQHRKDSGIWRAPRRPVVRWLCFSPTCGFRGRKGSTSSRKREPGIRKQDVCGTSNLENRRGYVRQPQSSGDRSSHGSGLGRSEADVIGSGADGSAVGKAGCA